MSHDDWRLSGAPNFRDFGGSLSASGRRVRTGVLFRSGTLSELNDEDLARLASLPARLIVDLRSDHERRVHPSRWPVDPLCRVREFNVTADMRSGEWPRPVERVVPTPAWARQLMFDTYRALPDGCAGALQALFEDLAESDASLPVVVHCTAGKDRTGFVCAAVLHALGVPLAAIEADYRLSYERCDPDRLAPQIRTVLHHSFGCEPDDATIDVFNRLELDYLHAAFEAVQRTHGGMDAYLARRCGLDDARRQRLREGLHVAPSEGVVPSPPGRRPG